MEIGDLLFYFVLRIAVSMSSGAKHKESERERDQFVTRSESKFKIISEIHLVRFYIFGIYCEFYRNYQKKVHFGTSKTISTLFDALHIF